MTSARTTSLSTRRPELSRVVEPNILLYVGVLVTVHPHHLVPSDVGEVDDQAGLAHAGDPCTRVAEAPPLPT